MKNLFTLLILCLFAQTTLAQKKNLEAIADSIKREAMVLYRSEMASWHGTDIVLEKLKHKSEQIGGYLSYDTGSGVNNVFFTKGEQPQVFSTITFGYDFNLQNYKLDSTLRTFTPVETELYAMRKKAAQALTTDTVFKHYNNASLNFIPTVYQNRKRVYMLTGPKIANIILIGNDYVIDFDKDNNIVKTTKIHKSLIPFNVKKGDNSETAIHTHLPQTGSFITATDICTLMMYGYATDWKSHIVMSTEYVSIWSMKNAELFIMTTEAWKKIAEHQASKKQ